MMVSPQSEPTYTIFIRLPFARQDFVDPPPVNWDSSKDEALWNVVSEVAKTEIDWNQIATRFQCTVDFLLQQVAFLTERHASQVRAQMRKAAVAAKGSAAPSPVPGSEGHHAFGEPLQGTASGSGTGVGILTGRPRAPSALSIQKDYPLPSNEGSTPGTPLKTARPPATRTSTGSSNAAMYTSRNPGGGSGKPTRASAEPQRHRLSSLPISTAMDDDEPEPYRLSPGPAETSSANSSDDSSPAQSRIIRRPPRFQDNDADDADDDDDDDQPAFLPYRAQTQEAPSVQHDLNSTLRGDPRNLARRIPGHSRIHQSQTSDSSLGSAAALTHRGRAEQSSRPGPLSPRRTMELAGRSPKGKGRYSRDSDGTPSMGSSFSDLDDASVTQSALEEALASKMQDGGIGSRMSTFGNALRSRYLPKPPNKP